MADRYELELIGITYNQIESGVYALILQQKGTTRRIPIIIGFPEAQAIECKLQDIKTPRPLTHDTMAACLSAFGLKLKEVEIKKLENGVFSADLHITDGVTERIVDARSSDAVALAIRVGAPIFTSHAVLLESGFDPTPKRKPQIIKKSIEQPASSTVDYKETDNLSIMSLEELSKAMLQASEKEDYEEAARIKAEIDSRKNESPD